MELDEDNFAKVVAALPDVEFLPGNLNSTYKYKALVPKELWNKWRPDKKLVNKQFREVNFGRPGYQQFHDRIGEWSSYDHNDAKRRDNYRRRHEPIRIMINGQECRSYRVPFTNEFFSYYLMW